MSTRLINSIAILEGLLLLCLSLAEIKRLRQYSEELKAGQELSARLSHRFAKATTESGLESPDDLAWTETSRWIVCGAGATLFAVGAIGLLGNWRGVSRLPGANHRVAETLFKVGVSSSARSYAMLLGAGVLAACFLIDLLQSSVRTVSHPATQIADLIWKLPPLPARIMYHLYSQMCEGVTPIKVPYNPTTGPWIVLENAMGDFATSNGIQIVRFESAGSTQAYVCVCNKDARAMRRFVRSIGRSANYGSSANGSQPVRSNGNQTSSAAGFRR